MGNGNVEWKPSNVVKNWMGVCMRFQALPLISQTLWQVGPIPWLISSSLFNNGNWGVVGDSLELGSTTKEAKSEADKKLEADERKAEKRKKDYAQKQLKEKFDKLKPLLTEFKKELDKQYENETDSTKKEKLWNTIKDIEECTKSATQANYDKMLEIYNANKEKIKEIKAKEVKEKVTSAKNSDYTTTVTTLSKKITDLTDDKFGILDEDKDLDEDIDIMELLSAWNSHDATKSKHIMRTIAEKYKSATGDNKSKYESLVGTLHNELYSRAKDIDESQLSEETKMLLKNAMDSFEKFDSIEKRFPNTESTVGKNYSDTFDNLYRAIRLAEAEIADKKLKESFDFLGDENPYKNPTLVTEAEADLNNEGLKVARSVTEPASVPDADLEVDKKAEENGYRKTNCNGVYYDETQKKHYYYDKTNKQFVEMENVGYVDDDGNCYKDNTKKEKLGTVTNGVYTTTETSPDANASGAGTGSTTPPAEKSVQDAVGTNFSSGIALGRNLHGTLNGMNVDSGAINNLNKITPDNIIGVIVGFENTKTFWKEDGVIEWLRDDGIGMDDSNKIVNALLQRAAACGLNATNCSEFKEIQEFLGAEVNSDGSYSFTKFNEEYWNQQRSTTDDKIFYTTENAEKLDKMILKLVEKIRQLNKPKDELYFG